MERGYRSLVTNALRTYCFANLPDPVEPPIFVQSTNSTISLRIRPNLSALELEAEDNPCRVLGYFIQVAKISDEELTGDITLPTRRWAVSHPCFPGISYTAEHLAPDSTYVFRVCATNAFGRSPYSAESSFMSTSAYTETSLSRTNTNSSNVINMSSNTNLSRSESSGDLNQSNAQSSQMSTSQSSHGTSMFWGEPASRTSAASSQSTASQLQNLSQPTETGRVRLDTNDSETAMSLSSSSQNVDFPLPSTNSVPSPQNNRSGSNFRTSSSRTTTAPQSHPGVPRASSRRSRRSNTPSHSSSREDPSSGARATYRTSSGHASPLRQGTTAPSNSNTPSPNRLSLDASQRRMRNVPPTQPNQRNSVSSPLFHAQPRSDPYFQYSNQPAGTSVSDRTRASVLNALSKRTPSTTMGSGYDLIEVVNLQSELHDAKQLIEAFRADSEAITNQLLSLQNQVDIFTGSSNCIDKMTLNQVSTTISTLEETLKKLQTRKAKLEECGKESGNSCVICLDAPKTVLVSPCNHVCFCEDCAELFDPKNQSDNSTQQQCPICRTQIKSILKIFL